MLGHSSAIMSGRFEGGKDVSPRPRERRFTIADGMILVAAMAAGLALARAGPMEWMAWTGSGWFGKARRLLHGSATLFAAMMSLGLIIVRLRRPRPRLVRVMRQPGMVASCAAAVALAVTALGWTSYDVIHTGGWSARDSIARYCRIHGAKFGPAVGAAWLGLWFAGRWRPERGWIDRAGRALGVFWLVSLLFAWPAEMWTVAAIRFLGGKP
jgi:hypothetical protein